MKPNGLRILWVKTGPLHPLDTGGKIRTYNMLKELKKKHHVTYLSLVPSGKEEEATAKASEYCQEAIWIPWRETDKNSYRFYLELCHNAFLSNLPYAVQKYLSSEMRNRIEALDRSGKYELIICDFLIPSINVKGPLLTPSILFQHNVESLIWKRRYDTVRGILKRTYLYNQWKRMERYERKGCLLFDGIVTVSKNDSEILEKELRIFHIFGDVPTGVDTSYFSPLNTVKEAGSIVFSGSMDWDPNEDAVFYFVEEIYPLVKKEIPHASFTVVGRNPSERLLSLSKTDPTIYVTGTVKDIRPYLASAEVYVVPLRIGGGTRIKIFEAMAMALPIVSTSIGAEGLSVSDHKNILLAEQPQLFAEYIITLLRNQKIREEIGREGLSFVQDSFSWQSVVTTFEHLCYKVIDKRRTNR